MTAKDDGRERESRPAPLDESDRWDGAEVDPARFGLYARYRGLKAVTGVAMAIVMLLGGLFATLSGGILLAFGLGMLGSYLGLPAGAVQAAAVVGLVGGWVASAAAVGMGSLRAGSRFAALRFPDGVAHVGKDGIRIDRSLRPARFVSFGELADIRDAKGAVVLVYRDGREESLLVAEPKPLARSLSAKLTAYRAAPGGEIAGLGGVERDVAAWIQRTRSLLGSADYRGAGVTREALERVLSDPRAPAEQRVGASFALADDPDEARRVRVRVAIDEVAQPELASAMRAAFDEEVEEHELARALAELS